MFSVTSDRVTLNKLDVIMVLVITCWCLCEGRTMYTGDIGVVIEREAVSSRLFLKWDYSRKFCQIVDLDKGETSNSHCEFSCETREYPPYFCPKGTFANDIWYETKRFGLRSFESHVKPHTFLPWREDGSAFAPPRKTMGIEFKCVTSAYCVSKPLVKIGPPPETYLSAIVNEKKHICAKDINGAVLVTQNWEESGFCIKFLSMHPLNNPNCEFCDVNDEDWNLDDDLKDTMKRLWRPCFENDKDWIYMLMYYWRRFGSCIFRDQTEYYRMAIQLFTQKIQHEKKGVVKQHEVLETDLCKQYIVNDTYCLIPYQNKHNKWIPVDMRPKLGRMYDSNEPGWYSSREDDRIKLANHIINGFLQVVS